MDVAIVEQASRRSLTEELDASASFSEAARGVGALGSGVEDPPPWDAEPSNWPVICENGEEFLEFDQTLGFPGEGPVTHLGSLAGFSWILSQLALLLALVPLSGLLASHHRFGVCVALACCGIPLVEAVESHPSHVVQALCPRDAADRKRAASRRGLQLAEGRPVLGRTQQVRERLLHFFGEWLQQFGLTLDGVLNPGSLDVESINTLLESYGRNLFHAGRPYGHFSETINAVAARRPRLRRSLQGAWDVAFSWLREEPPVHHVALPWQVLVGLLSLAFFWGWYSEAGVLALSFGGVTRIGEVLAAARRDLLLPSDFRETAQHVLLQIQEPKTRFRGARHQLARVDQPQLVMVIELAFSGLAEHQKLWPFSPQTLRNRFKRLLAGLGLDKLDSMIARGLDLGSLRAGGATWLLMVSEDSEMVRRRGRWISSKIMEIYVQEASASQFLHRLEASTRQRILGSLSVFPWALSWLVFWWKAGIPVRAWKALLGAQAFRKGMGG